MDAPKPFSVRTRPHHGGFVAAAVALTIVAAAIGAVATLVLIVFAGGLEAVRRLSGVRLPARGRTSSRG